MMMSNYRTTLKQDINNLKFLFNMVKNEAKSIIILNTFYAVLMGILPAVILKLEQKLLYMVTQDTQLSSKENLLFKIILLLFALCCIKLVSLITDFIKGYFSTLNGEKISSLLERKILEKYSSVPLQYYDRADFYELTSKVSVSQYTSPDKVFDIFFVILKAVVTVLSICALVPFKYISLLIFALIGAYLTFLGGIKNLIAKQKYREETNMDYRRCDHFRSLCTSEAYLSELKIFDQSNFIKNKYLNSRDQLFSKEMKLNVKTHTWEAFFLEIMNVINKIPYVILLYFVCTGKLSIDMFVLVTSSLSSLSQTLYYSFFYQFERIKTTSINLDYMRRFMQIENEDNLYVKKTTSFPKRGQHKIEFKDIHFCYPDTTVEVLKGVSFCINPGEMVALVGLNGSGKSTLIKLLMGLYEPQKGEILIDDININEYDVQSIRSLFATVLQDYCKYSLPLNEVLHLGDVTKKFDEAKAWESLQLCGLFECVNSMTSKLETSLTRQFDKESTELSDGQWQKLALARAIYSGKDILVFDEPTASFDVEAEVNFLNNIYKMRGNKTTFIITHRLSTAIDCDRVILLDNGIIAENGTHKKLMQDNKRYSELFRMQAERYRIK